MTYPTHLPQHETAVMDALLDAILAHEPALAVTVFCEDEIELCGTRDREAITEAMGASSETTILLHFAETPHAVGMIHLVHGNEPGVLIGDHTDTPEVRALLVEAEAVQRTYGEGEEEVEWLSQAATMVAATAGAAATEAMAAQARASGRGVRDAEVAGAWFMFAHLLKGAAEAQRGQEEPAPRGWDQIEGGAEHDPDEALYELETREVTTAGMRS